MPDALPPFAKDFRVEILASRPDGNVLASAKKTTTDLQADPDLPRYAEVTGKQKGWRFDLIVLRPESEPVPERRDVKDLDEPEIRQHLHQAERMLEAGFVSQSFIAAWAAFESAMRMRLRSQGEDAGWGADARTMLNELFSAGAFNYSVLRDLEGLAQLRNQVVHGFSAPEVGPNAVHSLVGAARRLLDDLPPARQTA